MGNHLLPAATESAQMASSEGLLKPLYRPADTRLITFQRGPIGKQDADALQQFKNSEFSLPCAAGGALYMQSMFDSLVYLALLSWTIVNTADMQVSAGQCRTMLADIHVQSADLQAIRLDALLILTICS